MSAFSKRPFDHRRSLHQPLKNPVKSTKQTNGSQPEEPWWSEFWICLNFTDFQGGIELKEKQIVNTNFFTPRKINGWFTWEYGPPWKRKIIWTKPSFLGSMLILRGVTYFFPATFCLIWMQRDVMWRCSEGKTSGDVWYSAKSVHNFGVEAALWCGAKRKCEWHLQAHRIHVWYISLHLP